MSSASLAQLISAIEIDFPSRWPHLLAHENQILGADIASGTTMSRRRGKPPRAREPTNQKARHAHLESRKSIRDAPLAARVVQMQAQIRRRENAVPHGNPART